MFGGRRYWQGNGGVYKGCCFPWDTWRVCFPATVCWKSFQRVHRQTDTQRRHSRPQAGTRFISQVPKVSLSLLKRKYMTGTFHSFFNLHLNRLIDTGKKTQKNKHDFMLTSVFCFLSAEPPSLTAKPPRKISADLDRNIDIPCQATGNALHTLF